MTHHIQGVPIEEQQKVQFGDETTQATVLEAEVLEVKGQQQSTSRNGDPEMGGQDPAYWKKYSS